MGSTLLSNNAIPPPNVVLREEGREDTISYHWRFAIRLLFPKQEAHIGVNLNNSLQGTCFVLSVFISDKSKRKAETNKHPSN
jgi:hypothetical protein